LLPGLVTATSLTDTDVISISKKLTTLEMKELNERQRAEHATRMYEQQKYTLRTLEDRNFELEQKFAEARCTPYSFFILKCKISLNSQLYILSPK